MQTPTEQPETRNPEPETSAPSTAPHHVGRPSTYSTELLDDLCTVIVQFGLSDSAAASACGLSTSTLSRWKQEDPELALALFSAREEFR